MKVKEAIKKTIKMNELLKEFGVRERDVELLVGRARFRVESEVELKKKLKEYFVKEFYNAILELDLDENHKAEGVFKFNTFDGKTCWDINGWDAEYSVEIVVY